MTGPFPSRVPVRPLSPDGLDGIGRVIGTHDRPRIINGGVSEKWDRLVPPEAFGHPMNLGILRTSPESLAVSRLERHLHTHQFFVPMAPLRYVVVVAGNDPAGPRADQLRAYLSDGTTGVDFHPGTWHSPLIPLDEPVPFVTAMRDTEVPDLDLRELDRPIALTLKGEPQ